MGGKRGREVREEATTTESPSSSIDTAVDGAM
jgi:hypothetical protein